MRYSSLPLRSLLRRPGRTIALGILIVFLSLSVFGGSILVSALHSGLDSLEARLGADVIVVPASAQSSTNLDALFLQGTTGYYYMDRARFAKIAETPGIAKISAQVFLASLRASCCSSAVQVIGIDQDTDFTIQPWLEKSVSQRLGDLDLVVGAKVGAGVGESIRIYNTNCPVVGRLAATGTELDTGVFCSVDTVHILLQAARDLGHDLKISGDPADVVSAVYIKAEEGYDIQKIVDDVNLQVRKVKAVKTRQYITGVSDSLTGVARTIQGLMMAVWLLAFLILMAAYCLLTGERRREFAVLRVIGLSRKKLSLLLVMETLLLTAVSAIIGMALACLILFPFSDLIAESLGLPFLLPGTGMFIRTGCLTFFGVLAVGAAACALSAYRLSRVDIGQSLREGN